MFKVEAIIRQEKLEEVKDALAKEGIMGLTVYSVRGRGRQKGYILNFRGREVRVDLLPKIKLELIIKDGELEKVIRIIRERAFTGEVGDGKIFFYPVQDIIRIRTAERGEEAI